MLIYGIPVSYFEHMDRCLLSSVLFSVECFAASGGHVLLSVLHLGFTLILDSVFYL